MKLSCFEYDLCTVLPLARLKPASDQSDAGMFSRVQQSMTIMKNDVNRGRTYAGSAASEHDFPWFSNCRSTNQMRAISGKLMQTIAISARFGES